MPNAVCSLATCRNSYVRNNLALGVDSGKENKNALTLYVF